jgi:hypothetical protein
MPAALITLLLLPLAPTTASETWVRGIDLRATSAHVDGTHQHAALQRPGQAVWSYHVVQDRSRLLDPRAWQPLPLVKDSLYAEEQYGEGEQRFFIRHRYRATPAEFATYWNKHAELPANDWARGGMVTCFTAPEAGTYRMTGPIRWRGWGAASPRQVALTIGHRRGDSVRPLGEWPVPDAPEPKQGVLVDLAGVNTLQQVRLRRGDQLIFALPASRHNYRGVAVNDTGVRIELLDAAGANASEFATEDDAPLADPYADAADGTDLQRCLSLLDLQRPELADVAEAYRAGDMTLAMTRYRDHLLQRIAAMSFEPHVKLWLFAPTTAADALTGHITYAHYGEPTQQTRSFVGLPGNVEWDHVPANGYATFTRDLATMFWAARLVEAFAHDSAGNPQAAALWAGYWGDLGRHWLTQQRVMEQDPELLEAVERRSILWPSRSQLYFAWRVGNFFSQFVELVRADPATAAEAIDPADLAAALAHIATFEMSEGIGRLERPGGAPNQRRELAMAVLEAGVVLQDFRDAPRWRDAGMADWQAFLSRETMPDGTSLEQSFNYNKSLPASLRRLSLLVQNLPASAQRDAMLERFATLARDRWAMLHSLAKPDGNLPTVGNTNPYRHEMPWPDEAELAGLPVSQRIHQAIAAGGDPPAFTSVYFRFGGYAALRNGWGDTDHYTFFKNSRPGLGHRREGGNGLSLWAFGRPLLVNSGAEMYGTHGNFREYFNSTVSQNSITVDGLSQYIGHADPEDLPYDQPIAARWFTSDTLDYVEAIYAGDYAGWNHRVHGNATAPEAFRYMTGDGEGPTVTDTTHRRQVFFLKQLPAWIIVDHVDSKTQRLFTQSWCFPPDVDADAVSLHENERVVQAIYPDGLALNLSQYIAEEGPPLAYETHYGVSTEGSVLGWTSLDRSDRSYNFAPAVDLHSSWRSSGLQRVVTLISAGRVVDSQALHAEATADKNSIGFTASLADGSSLRFSLMPDGRAEVTVTPDAADAAAAVAAGWSISLPPDPASPGSVRGLANDSSEATRRVAVPTGFRWVSEEGSLVPSYDESDAAADAARSSYR